MPYKKSDFAPMVGWVYDIIIWSFSVLVDLFFREVHPRGAFRIPRKGPVIFVAAPHANQFVDPLILMRAVRLESRRRIAFLVAEKSMRRRFIGWLSRCVGAVPVARALDMTKAAAGRIYLPDPEGQPLKIRGIGTTFTKDLTKGGLLVLPTVGKQSAASSEVAEVLSDEEVILKKEFKGKTALEQLTAPGGEGEERGTKFKVAPKVDQTQVYDAVFERLNSGGCVGIFPEGGSHDRTELLPLKAGVAIMALGALAANPDCGLKIVPVGMNYFHAHKFRSRAVIEFGNPIDVPKELVEQYTRGDKREAVRALLAIIYNGLVAVTVTSPDYDTLMVIQAVRRLYKPAHKKLPLPMVVELNRRLVTGYTHYKDNPRIIHLRSSVSEYNRQLRLLGLRDHQVEYAKFSIPWVIATLLYRLAKLIVLGMGALPGFILFAPVFAATRIISRKKAREALKASTVKVQGRDVMATWKLLVALAFAPILYNFYVVLLCWWAYFHRVFGLMPDWIPIFVVPLVGWVLFPTITFAALRFGEVGMDIFKSLRPLVLCLNPTSANTLHKLREKRQFLSQEVTELINTLGPELFPDFDSARVIADPFSKDGMSISYGQERRDSEASFEDFSPIEGPSTSSEMGGQNLPRNESFANLGSIGLFASRPVSRARSRSNSGGFPIKAMSHLEEAGQDGFAEVSKKISTAMAERFAERTRRRKGSQEWEEAVEVEQSSDEESEDEGKKDI
ncbi:Glycerol-3-phosphate/dihydroxyacetone phosphate acyltransferase [Rhizina undulata]